MSRLLLFFKKLPTEINAHSVISRSFTHCVEISTLATFALIGEIFYSLYILSFFFYVLLQFINITLLLLQLTVVIIIIINRPNSNPQIGRYCEIWSECFEPCVMCLKQNVLLLVKREKENQSRFRRHIWVFLEAKQGEMMIKGKGTKRQS